MDKEAKVKPDASTCISIKQHEIQISEILGKYISNISKIDVMEDKSTVDEQCIVSSMKDKKSCIESDNDGMKRGMYFQISVWFL